MKISQMHDGNNEMLYHIVTECDVFKNV